MPSDGIARHTPVLAGTRVIRSVVVDSELLPTISELLQQTLTETEWLEVGDSVSDILEECWNMSDLWYGGPMVGLVGYFYGVLPVGWLPFDGVVRDMADYPELWAVLDDGVKDEQAETFTLPNVENRFVSAAGGSYAVGELGGSDAVQLSVSELPSHDHTYIPPVVSLDLKTVGAPNVTAAVSGSTVPTGATGGDGAHENRPSFVALRLGVFSGRV